MKKEQVLIVEDDADIRDGVRILLESEGYAVMEAEDGRQGLYCPDSELVRKSVKYRMCRFFF